jgi:hypothetical protein
MPLVYRLAPIEASILFITDGFFKPVRYKKILRKAGKWMAKMPRPFASNYFKPFVLLLNALPFRKVPSQNGLCFLFFLGNEYGIQIRL